MLKYFLMIALIAICVSQAYSHPAPSGEWADGENINSHIYWTERHLISGGDHIHIVEVVRGTTVKKECETQDGQRVCMEVERNPQPITIASKTFGTADPPEQTQQPANQPVSQPVSQPVRQPANNPTPQPTTQPTVVVAGSPPTSVEESETPAEQQFSRILENAAAPIAQ